MKTRAQGLQAQVEGTGRPWGLGDPQSFMGPGPQGPGKWAVGPGSLTEGLGRPQRWEEGVKPPREDWGWPAAPVGCTWARRVSPPGSGYLAWQSCPSSGHVHPAGASHALLPVLDAAAGLFQGAW